MNKVVLRIAATLLIPALLIDPATGSGFIASTSGRPSSVVSSNIFGFEALNAASNYIITPALMQRFFSARVIMMTPFEHGSSSSLTVGQAVAAFSLSAGILLSRAAHLDLMPDHVTSMQSTPETLIVVSASLVVAGAGFKAISFIVGALWHLRSAAERQKIREDKAYKRQLEDLKYRQQILWKSASSKKIYKANDASLDQLVFVREEMGIDPERERFMTDPLVATAPFPSLQKTAYGLVGQLVSGLADNMSPDEAQRVASEIIKLIYRDPARGPYRTIPDFNPNEMNELKLSEIYVYRHVDPYLLKPIVVGIQGNFIRFKANMSSQQITEEVSMAMQLNRMHVEEVKKGFQIGQEEAPTVRMHRLRNYLIKLAEQPGFPYTVTVRRIDRILAQHPEWGSMPDTVDPVLVVDPYSWNSDLQKITPMGILPREIAAKFGLAQQAVNVYVQYSNDNYPSKTKAVLMIRAEHKTRHVRGSHVNEFSIPGGMKYDPGVDPLDRLATRMGRQLRFPDGHQFARDRFEHVNSLAVQLFSAPNGDDAQFRITYIYTLTEDERAMLDHQIAELEAEKRNFDSGISFEGHLARRQDETNSSRWDARLIFVLTLGDLITYVERIFDAAAGRPHPESIRRPFTLEETFKDPQTHEDKVETIFPVPNHDLLVSLFGPKTSAVRIRLTEGLKYRQQWLAEEKRQRAQFEAAVASVDRNATVKPTAMKSHWESLHQAFPASLRWMVEIVAAVSEEIYYVLSGEGLTEFIAGHTQRVFLHDVGRWVSPDYEYYAEALSKVESIGQAIRQTAASVHIWIRLRRLPLAIIHHIWFNTLEPRAPYYRAVAFSA